MTNLVEAPAEWVAGIYQLETNDPVVGGADGIDNLQATQLAKRTAYLKEQVEAAQGGLTAHEAAADPHPVYLTSAEGDAKVAAAVAVLVASSPAALDTLNELAAAMGNDQNFAATLTAALAGKAPWATLDQIITAAGLTVDHNNSAQPLEAIQRLIDAQAGNYALDTGAANAYVVALSPAIAAYTDGMTVRVKAVNANNGASTLNAGGGAVSLVSDVGGALVGGDIPAGGIFTATYIASAGKFYITSLVQSQGFGFNQTWQNLTASRALGTTYYNTTGKPIVVSVLSSSTVFNSTSSLNLQVNGSVFPAQTSVAVGGTGVSPVLNMIVPPGASYNATAVNGTLGYWAELR